MVVFLTLVSRCRVFPSLAVPTKVGVLLREARSRVLAPGQGCGRGRDGQRTLDGPSLGLSFRRNRYCEVRHDMHALSTRGVTGAELCREYYCNSRSRNTGTMFYLSQNSVSQKLTLTRA